MKKKLAVLGVSVILLMSGCSTKRDIVPGEVTTKCMTIVDETSGYSIYKHDETGVHYLVIIGMHEKAVCVMVNPDGTPYVNK